MHLGNGAITAECAAAAWGAAVAGLGWLAIRKPRSETPGIDRATDPLQMGCWAALVFALQAINVPVLPWASAHLVGGVLLARLFGPARGAFTLAGILLVQALVMGDGGWRAWGCNVINMALLPAFGVMFWELFAARRSFALGRTTEWAVLSAIGGIAILAAAALIPLQTAVGRSETLPGWTGFVSTMLVTHLAVAILETVISFALLASAARLQSIPSQAARISLATTAVLLGIVGMTVSSALPDGYEFSIEQVGWNFLLDAGDSAPWLVAALSAVAVGIVVTLAAKLLDRGRMSTAR